MPTDHQQDWEQRLRAALDSREADELTRLLAEAHAADLAAVFVGLDDTGRTALLEVLTDEQAAEMLDELAPDERDTMLDILPMDRASDIVEEMPSDEAADLLAELSPEEADALLERMEPESAEEVADLLRYPEDTAGGLMAKEFVQVGPDQTVGEVMALLRHHHDDAEMIYYLFVVDEEGRLLGVVNLRRLIVSDPRAAMSDIMDRECVSVPTAMPQAEVAELVRRRDLLAVPVLDPEGRIQGIVTVDDVGDVVREEAAEDLLEISGSDEPAEAPRERPVRRGWRSGLLALAGGAAAAALVWHFSGVLTDWRHVAILLPLLLVLGLTMSSQAALAMDHAYDSAVERHLLGRIFVREALAGAALAILGGLLAGGFVLALWRTPALAAPVGVPMAAALWTASLAGALEAVVLRRSGGRLGPATHTAVVALALLVGVAVYFVAAELVNPLGPRPPS